MADVGEISIVARARAEQIDRDLRVIERKVLDSGNRSAKAFEQGFRAVKILGALGAVEGALKLANAASAAWKGNLAEAATILETLPFGVGGLAKATGDLYLQLSGLQNRLDEARAGAVAAQRDLAIARRGKEMLDRINDEIQMALAPSDAARARLRIMQEAERFKRQVEGAGLRGYEPDVNAAADKLRELRLKELERAEKLKVEARSAGGSEFSGVISAAGVGLGLLQRVPQIPARLKDGRLAPAAQGDSQIRDAPKAKQIDRTNTILNEISRKLNQQRPAIAG